MRRALVVTDDTARHPFLQSLPPHVRAGVEALPIPRPPLISLADVRHFLIAYCTCFTAVMAFIN
ncbi:MAG: hypothetical protein ABJA20_06125 [Novosphingobium sp.]